jgi:hypothetical protein
LGGGRWGQAATLVQDVLFIQGGKTDAWNTFGYTSAPTNNDLLFLDLDRAFDPAQPPWDYVGGSANACTTQGPAVAWHTVSAFSTAGVLLFGGAPSPGDPYAMSGADSASLLDIWDQDAPVWTCQANGWASEPMRRIKHSSASFGGKVFLIGGLKADGSGNALADHYVFDPTVPSFTRLSSTDAPPDIYGHVSAVLPDGRAVVMGGYVSSAGAYNPFTSIWVLDTTQSPATWAVASVSSSTVPASRIGFVAAAIDSGRILIQGGSDEPRQTVYSDGWILDTTQNPWTWTEVPALTQVGQRVDHFAVQYGSSVVFGFGGFVQQYRMHLLNQSTRLWRERACARWPRRVRHPVRSMRIGIQSPAVPDLRNHPSRTFKHRCSADLGQCQWYPDHGIRHRSKPDRPAQRNRHSYRHSLGD